MKLRFLPKLILFIQFFKSSIQLDLSKSFLRHRDLVSKYGDGLFTQDMFKSMISDEFFRENNVSSECSSALNDLFAEANRNESKFFFDAWSSKPSGMLYGQLYSFGNFDECIAAKITSSHSKEILRGKYRLISVAISANESLALLFYFGVCLPHTCNGFDVSNLFSGNFKYTRELYSFFGHPTNDKKFQKIEMTVVQDEDDITNEDHVAANIGTAIFSIIFFLVILSSLYEVSLNYLNGKPNYLLKTFSIFTNCKILFEIKARSSSSSEVIECVNGMRALTLIWNVFGHTYMWSILRSDSNAPERVKHFLNFSGKLSTTAHFSVDSFLLLSGLLVAWLGLQRMSKRNGRLSIWPMYRHRYLRITPCLAAVTLYGAGLQIFFGSGPVWYDNVLSSTQTCRNYWWRSLLYIDNFFSHHESCLGFSWFLAADMQLFLFSPLILIGFWNWPRATRFIVISVLTYSRILVFFAVTELQSRLFVFDGILLKREELITIFQSTHLRAGPWLIGVLLGHTLFKQRNQKHELSNLHNRICWLLTMFCIFAMIFGPQYLYSRGLQPSLLEAALHESVGRCVWALSLAWIIYSCYFGYSELLNSFLSHPAWQIIARLNYAIFVTKSFINENSLGLQKTSAHFSQYEMIGEFWADFGHSATVAVILALSIELPFQSLEKYFFNKRVVGKT